MAVRLADLNLNGTGSCASFNFRRAARAVTRFYDQALEPCGIRSTQFTILVGVAKTQPTSISALADVLVIDGNDFFRSPQRASALWRKACQCGVQRKSALCSLWAPITGPIFAANSKDSRTSLSRLRRQRRDE